MTSLTLSLTVNGRPVNVDAHAHESLLVVLRDRLGLVDVKEGCGEGVCGACTVLLDGRPVSSCLVLAGMAQGREVLTVSGLGRGEEPHPLQAAFVEHGAVQCGFCIPGMVLTAYAFLAERPQPTREEIRRAISGNLCRCTGYTKIVDAIEAYVRSGGERS